MYPELDPEDKFQRRPTPESIFYGDFGVSRFSRDRLDRKKIGSIDFTISRSPIKPSGWSTHITSVFLWVMTGKWVSESSSILYKIGRGLITTTKSSLETWEYDHFDWKWLFYVVIVQVFQAWWKMRKFWWIVIDSWTSVENVELDRRIIRFWSKFGQIRFPF